MTRFARIALPCAAALALAACEPPKLQDLGVEGRARPVAGADGAGAAGNCDGCHGDRAREGDALVRAAPPAALLGRDPGAHLAHVTGATFRAPLGCAECHYVPTLRGHADGTVSVAMVGLGAADSAAPAWDAETGTCSGVYCHGATLGGGPTAPAAWFAPAGLGCTSCHGSPPPAPHPAGATCGACHAGYTASSVNAATHLNGAIDASGGHPAGFEDPAQHGQAANGGLAGCRTCHGAALTGGTSGVSCDSCHGGAGWRTDCTFCHGTAPDGPASPPVDTLGRAARTWASVGAHAAHVATAITAPLACADCHPDRAGSDAATDAAHVDGDRRAEVVLGARAGAGATYARASDTSATCASTACHGAAPIEWTSAAPLGCDGCHGAPPPSPHTANPSCGGCHSGYTASSANPATHLDGTVQASDGHAAGYREPAAHGAEVNRVGLAPCTACHGADLQGGVSGVSCDGCHGGTTAWRSDCTFCHGADPSGPASPPVDTQGRAETAYVSVGAHAAHVTTSIAAPLACTVCHPDRAGSDVLADAGHVDGDARAEVVFGPRAGASAAYARASDTSATCTSTACHGAAPAQWTSTAALGCGSCHGAPPPAPHTTSTACGGCHTGYTSSTVRAATHVDGAVQATNPHAAGYANPTAHGYEVNRTGLVACRACHGTDLASCDACHGGAAWRARCTFCHGADPSGPASPPVDTQGRTARSNVSVGAHAAHVATALTTPLACTDCHPDRADSDAIADPAHVDGNARAEIALSARAGASATYARASATSATCAATYCHGAGAIEWTSTAALGCTGCHGAPPPSPHTTNPRCGACHSGYDTSSVNPATHLDGTVQGTDPHPAGYVLPSAHGYATSAGGFAACQACHGADLAGGLSGVSCDTCHTAWRSDCTFCHGTPGGSSAPPVDARGRSTTANVSVGAHAAHRTTALTSSAITCADCHPARAGDVLAQPAHVDGDARAEVAFSARSGGAAVVYARASDTSATCASTHCHGTATVEWTSTTDLTCGSCHGAPPAEPHTSNPRCGACHSGYGTSSVNPATHLDGNVTGTDPHPAGYVLPSAHGREASQGGFEACRACHGTDLAGGISGVSCDGCHGGSAWRTSCTFCHGTPSGAASPPVDTVGRSDASFVTVGAHAAHVATGLRDGGVACAECHADRAGSDATTDAAHVDGDGRAEVAFGPVATAGAPFAAYARASDVSATCSSTHCHGAAPIEWTDATPLGCGSCHGAPPPEPHPQLATCSGCHAGYTSSSVDPATHLDGAVQFSSPHAAGYSSGSAHGYEVNRTGLASCTGCHGGGLASCDACHATAGFPAWATTCTFCHGAAPAGPASPPVDTQGGSNATSVRVGLHASHVGTTIATPLACTECHADRSTSDARTDAAHVDGDGVAEVAFGALARTGGVPATYARASESAATCASTYCHGRFTGGADPTGVRAPLSWTSTAQVSCTGSCHNTPPTTIRHTRHLAYTPSPITCADCHGAGYGTTAVVAGTHADGVKTLSLEAGTFVPATRSCGNFQCHGKFHTTGYLW